MSISTCILPAAGFGTRFLPATKSMPKEMLPVVNTPLIHFAVEEAISAQMRTMGIVYGRYKKAIPDYFDSHYELEVALANSSKKTYLAQLDRMIDSVNFAYIRQPKALGLGHAILTAQPLVGHDAFAVILADDLCFNPDGDSILQQMCQVYEQHKSSCVIAVEEVPHDRVNQYGIVAGKQVDAHLMAITEMQEKPQPEQALSNLAVIGRYIITSDVFPILERLYNEQQANNLAGELQITTALNEMAHSGHSLLAYKFNGKRFDCGSLDGMMQATRFVYDNGLYVK